MSKISEIKKILIIFLLLFFIICSSKSADAWVPPSGCVADSWLLINNPEAVEVHFFKDNKLVCGYALLNKTNQPLNWNSLGYTFFASGEVDVSADFMGGMKPSNYAFMVGMLGLLCGAVFILGLRQ